MVLWILCLKSAENPARFRSGGRALAERADGGRGHDEQGNRATTTGGDADQHGPDPFSFDIDRYLSPCNEHHSARYAPYGLGTQTCLGSRWMELQLAVNVLMIAHYFTLEVSPTNYSLQFSPLPSMKPSKKLEFHIAEQKGELPV